MCNRFQVLSIAGWGSESVVSHGSLCAECTHTECRGHWGGVIFSVNADGHVCVVSTAGEKSPGRGAFPGLGAKKEPGRFKKGGIRKYKCPGTPY